jgi:hypothetical protein
VLELGEERCPWGGRGVAEQWPPQPRFPPLFLPIKIREREEEKRKRKGDGEEDEEEKEKKRKKRKKEIERERAERRERKGEEEAEKRKKKKRREREKEKTEQTADDNSRASSRQVSFLPSLIRLLFSFHWHAERNSRSATNE